MNDERCTTHGIMRCSTCAYLEAKKNKTKPSIVQPILAAPPSTKVGVPPPSISNAPPEDIEMMDVHEVNRAREAYHKELDSLLETKARQEAINAAIDVPIPEGYKKVGQIHDEVILAEQPLRVHLGNIPFAVENETFETLPVDDSHASKVMRAASAYADAARDYALKLASYTKIAEELKTAAERLTEAALMRDKAEKDLQTLVAGGEKL